MRKNEDAVGEMPIGRRSMLASAGAATLLGLSGSRPRVRPSLEGQVKENAQRLAASMRAMHGCDCWVHVDQEAGVVSVSLLRS